MLRISDIKEKNVKMKKTREVQFGRMGTTYCISLAILWYNMLSNNKYLMLSYASSPNCLISHVRPNGTKRDQTGPNGTIGDPTKP